MSERCNRTMGGTLGEIKRELASRENPDETIEVIIDLIAACGVSVEQ